MASNRKKLTLREWWDEVGTENVTKVAEHAGTNIAYLRLLRYRIKRPGYDLAIRLIEAAKLLTPRFEPSLELLMQPVPKREPDPNYSPAIQPSAAFTKARKQVAA